MSDADRERWDKLYEQGAYQDRTHPTVFLAEQIDSLPPGRALDLGCGAGRNAVFLAAAGYQVDAWDISEVGLARAAARAADLDLDIVWQQRELQDVELPEACYDLIVQVRYVNRDLLGRIARALRPGGCYLSEQHLVTDREVVGPSRPEFRYTPGELRTGLTDLDIEVYRESHIEDPDSRLAALVQVVARKPIT